MEDRLLDAALRCVARWGVSKTSLDDVAREAGSSRATLYRQFLGGKDALFQAVVREELARFLGRIRSTLTDASDLEAALVGAMTEAGRTLTSHAALGYLLEHEPELVLPKLAFRELDEVLALVRVEVGPQLARHVGGDLDEAARTAEWAARIVLSYTLSPAVGVDTTDPESVRRLVRSYILPGVAHAAAMAT
jgi:TetR/AcrR family transcriptional repressor of uid operon